MHSATVPGASQLKPGRNEMKNRVEIMEKTFVQWMATGQWSVPRPPPVVESKEKNPVQQESRWLLRKKRGVGVVHQEHSGKFRARVKR